jgi:hypothetical protein
LFTRQVYSLFDALGDFGGLAGVIEAIAAFILGPISSHSFLAQSISALFLAKSKVHGIFSQKISNPKK